jgi:hypothetical protein
MNIISPTGFGVRQEDEWGKGCFGAPRGDRLHKGTDFMLCRPGRKLEIGKPVFSPCTGKIIREVYPYTDGSHYRGLLIANTFGDFMMFYLIPFPRLLHVGHKVNIGQEIGLAQDSSKKDPANGKYDGMIPHIHLQIQVHSKNLLSGNKKEFINPEALM